MDFVDLVNLGNWPELDLTHQTENLENEAIKEELILPECPGRQLDWPEELQELYSYLNAPSPDSSVKTEDCSSTMESTRNNYSDETCSSFENFTVETRPSRMKRKCLRRSNLPSKCYKRMAPTIMDWLFEVVSDPKMDHLVHWADERGQFKVRKQKADSLAQLWYNYKRRPVKDWNYFSKSLRTHYGRELLQQPQHFTFKFSSLFLKSKQH